MQTLKSKKEYDRLRLSSQKIFGKYFLFVYIIDELLTDSKAGITVSKKVGNAVIRNKIKRRLRVVLFQYQQPDRLNKFFICNFIALKPAAFASWIDFKSDVINILDRLCSY